MDATWPTLPYESWIDTQATLHRCLQVAGKILLGRTPLVNHYWNAALKLTPRGLSTGPMPLGARTFAIDFDFVDHRVDVYDGEGGWRVVELGPRPVADFYRDLLAELAALDIRLAINDLPSEIRREVIPFRLDRTHASYDRAAVEKWFAMVRATATVLDEFRARFVGKASPTHFFWGGFDLASSRFSGRRAPPLPDGGRMERESFSHEEWSAGLWTGDDRFPATTFYAYAMPPPPGFADARVMPSDAFWERGLQNFLLPYETVRRSDDPRATLLTFLQSTYAAAADLGHWDRANLERHYSAEPPEATVSP